MSNEELLERVQRLESLIVIQYYRSLSDMYYPALHKEEKELVAAIVKQSKEK